MAQVWPQHCVLCGPMLLELHPISGGLPCRVLPATGAETIQQAVVGRGEGSKDIRGISFRHQHPRSTSRDSGDDDTDEARPKRWDQRAPQVTDQVLAHLCP